ncbi:hypothetical protein AVDCRST_MAG81-783 [uncultured Synechococcales cyanobacterium]|uniref:Uncharacterized protein n=1 Tax=uncultured Synechococcales cyanobacterium TaxID=1936017 RepID=A0A6J4V231_9CYAN|nr:hypothetical protein AVDCRST_MAG81-783 [uncultured Synechococcales cyanobacterium]
MLTQRTTLRTSWSQSVNAPTAHIQASKVYAQLAHWWLQQLRERLYPLR